MNVDAVNLDKKFALFSEQWTPKAVGRVNDYMVKIAKIKGEFVWHTHDQTDELFFVHRGHMRIDLRGPGEEEASSVVTLGPGDIYVVRRGVEHRPVAQEECEILMFEPSHTRNTGNVENDRTVATVDWI